MTAPLVILAAGGTGGHVFPAEALAQALSARGYRLALMTDSRGAAYGGVLGTIETHRLKLARMSGGPVTRARGFVSLGTGFLRARSILRRLAPGVVVGFGGYPSLPTVLAASRLGIPTAIHEQNAVLGRANRMLASRVNAIATAFPTVRFLDEGRHAVLTGNPVRPAVLGVRDHAYAAPRPDQTLRLLVFGGSQGAHVFSKVVPAALGLLAPHLRGRLAIVQQCRPEDIDTTRAAFTAIGVEAELQTFFTDMPARLAAAHLVIARAGASTVAELGVAGRPALLVPYPHATDDHQTANAAAFAKAGGGWTTSDSEFNAMSLAERLSAFLADPAPLARAAAAARSFAQPDAAERLADLVQRLAPIRHNGGTQFREAAE